MMHEPEGKLRGYLVGSDPAQLRPRAFWGTAALGWAEAVGWGSAGASGGRLGQRSAFGLAAGRGSDRPHLRPRARLMMTSCS